MMNDQGAKQNRRKWTKVNVPDEMGDLIQMVAKRENWKPDEIHWFLFDAIRSKYPDTVEQALGWLGREWIDEDALRRGNEGE
jgi:3-oxoacyl-[acyl-carrier-protein] synthase III